MRAYILLVVAVLVSVTTHAQDDWSQNEAIKRLTKALITQDLYINERIRSDGDSGIKQVRMKGFSTRPYLSNTFTSHGPAAIHNHDNNIRTLGMGEFDAVLNGVEFRTRHNDYRLRMPSTTSSDYHAVEDIPFPPVPETVLQQTTVEGQVAEMKKYFEAFSKQRKDIRDYTDYFQPVLCYLEGAWTNHTDSIEESFDSDRHFLDADSWEHLEDKVRFNSYAGAKDNAENIAFLPSKVWDVQDDGMIPYFAQWNYRILCHKLKFDLRLNRFRVVDDLASRMRNRGQSLEEYAGLRRARFQLNGIDRAWDKNNGEFYRNSGGFIDSLMSQIPGMNNYGAQLKDTAYGQTTTDLQGNPLNAANYHQLYQTSELGAGGQTMRTRGYSDKAIYMAMTNHSQVRGRNLIDCNGKNDCGEWFQRWTYAIPLEIVYLTPLSNWNPYDIRYWGESVDAKKTVTGDGSRDGSSEATAFNGVDGKRYYRTPAEFFAGDSGESDDADTSRDYVWVLDNAGNPHKTSSSGHHIVMPEIADVGKVRQRYPIFPIHQEGSLSIKELEALKDIIFRKEEFSHMYYDSVGTDGTVSSQPMDMLTSSSAPQYGNHKHVVHLTSDNVDRLSKGEEIFLNTEQASGHHHWLKLAGSEVMGKLVVTIVTCGHGLSACWDGHTGDLTEM